MDSREGFAVAEVAAKSNKNGRANICSLLGPCFFLPCKLVGTISLYQAQQKLAMVSVMTDYFTLF